MRTFIAGIDVDRRLWRDLLRPLHMVPAPPQAVTLPTPAPPTMATTNLKSGALAIHRGDGRRHVPGRSRQQHHASTGMGSFCYPFNKCRAPLGTRLQSAIIPIPDPRFAGDPSRGSIPIPIPDLPGIGGPSPPPAPPSPICGGSGIIPIPGSHRGFRALLRKGSVSSDHTFRASTRDDNRGNSMCH
jgi:hypothetical protein